MRSSLIILLLLCSCQSSSLPPGDVDLPVDAGDAGGNQNAKDAGGDEPDAGIVVPDAGTVTCEEPFRLDPLSDSCRLGPFLDVIACPAYLSLSCLVTYPPMGVGSSSTETISLYNSGELPLTISSLLLSGEGFELASTTPQTIGVQQTVSVPIRFAPLHEGLVRGTIEIESDAVNRGSRTIPLEGSTPNNACNTRTDCLSSQTCGGMGQCESCIEQSPPSCRNGQLVLNSDGNGCLQPACVCHAGRVYRAGECVVAEPCSNGTCADGGTCELGCSTFPGCEVPIDGGVCF